VHEMCRYKWICAVKMLILCSQKHDFRKRQHRAFGAKGCAVLKSFKICLYFLCANCAGEHKLYDVGLTETSN